MNRRKLVIAVIIAVLLSLCGLMLFIGIVTVRNIGINPDELVHITTAWAEEDDSKTVKTSGPLYLEVHNISGVVDIKAAKEDEVKIDIHKKAGGISQQAAQKNLEKLKVDISKSGERVVIDATADDNMGFSVNDINIDLTIYVPPDCPITVDNRFGDVLLSGTTGDVKVESDFGSLTISDLNGSINAILKNGDILIQDVAMATGVIDVQTDFGDVTLKSIDAEACTIKSNNGNIEIADMDIENEIRTDSSFGSIQYDRVLAKNIFAGSESGSLNLNNIEAKNLVEISTSLGDVTIEDVDVLNYKITSLSGRIDGNGLSGGIQAQTDFGDIDLKNCHADDLTLSSKNGSVVYQGSLGDGPHSISTDFGDIQLDLPEDTSLSLDLKTDFGIVKTDFELLVSDNLEGDHLKGKIGKGGASLEAMTNNGDIVIHKTDDTLRKKEK